MRHVLVSILRCPKHGFYALAVSAERGAPQLRVTDGKCCGSWDEVRAFSLDADRLIQYVEEHTLEVAFAAATPGAREPVSPGTSAGKDESERQKGEAR